MRCLAFILLNFHLLMFSLTAQTDGVPTSIKSVGLGAVDTDWMSSGAVKYGFLSSLCLYQTITGMTEGYHFRNGQDVNFINSGNYHAWATGQRISGLATGWCGYALVRSEHMGWKKKLGVAIGSALIARNAFEWSYKATRYGNPFDYSEEHNEHALVGFGIRNGKLTDVYIGLGPISGPLVDLACMTLGTFLVK